MATEVSMLARIRGALRDVYGVGDQRPVAADGGELIVVQGMPELAEIVRQGNSFQVALTTGLTALTALPTTTSGLTLQNAEPATGKSYVIDTFGSWEAIIDTTQRDITAIFAMLNARGDAAPTGTALTTIKSLSGKTSYGGNGIARTTGTVVNNGWFAHNTIPQQVPVLAGNIWAVNEVNCRGLYVVPPGGAFSVQAVKAVASGAAQQFFFIRWHELQLTLG